MLLTIVRAAKSFEDLRTLDGTKYVSFHEACMTLGLATNNSEWDDALFEISTWVTWAQFTTRNCTFNDHVLTTKPEIGCYKLLITTRVNFCRFFLSKNHY